MGRPRRKEITPKTFHKLWDNAVKADSKESYIKDAMRYGDYDSVIKDLGYTEMVDLLSSIYKLSEMSFREILNKCNLRQSEVSDIYCVPIRTVEEWYSGKNKCPSYFRIILLKDNGLFKLNVNIIKKKPKEAEPDRLMELRNSETGESVFAIVEPDKKDEIKRLLEKTAYLKRFDTLNK